MKALRTFTSVSMRPAAGNSQAPPELAAAMRAFWKDGDAKAISRLRALLVDLRGAPAVIRARMKNPAFLWQGKVWLDATQLWAGASIDALDALVFHRTGQPERDAALQVTARAQRTEALLLVVPDVSPPASIQLAGGVLETFVHFALRGYGP